MSTGHSSIDAIIDIFSIAVKKTLDSSTGKTIKISETFQSIPKVVLRPDMGCFVQFTGDYNGLAVMNFTAEAAMMLYRSYMINMGLSADDLAKDCTSKEVEDTMGEMTNQIMGRAARMVEGKYDLSANFGQPKSLALNSAITLTPETEYMDNRRACFRVGTERFYLELAMEKSEFIQHEK